MTTTVPCPEPCLGWKSRKAKAHAATASSEREDDDDPPQPAAARLDLELAVRRVAGGARLGLVAAASASPAATAADAHGADRRVPLAGVGLRARKADGAARDRRRADGVEGLGGLRVVVAVGVGLRGGGVRLVGRGLRVVGGRMDAVAVGPRGRAVGGRRHAGRRRSARGTSRRPRAAQVAVAVLGLLGPRLVVPVLGLRPRLPSQCSGSSARGSRPRSGVGHARLGIPRGGLRLRLRGGRVRLPRPGPVVLDRPRRGDVRVVLAGRVPLERRGRVGRARGPRVVLGRVGHGRPSRSARRRSRSQARRLTLGGAARPRRSRLPNNGAISAPPPRRGAPASRRAGPRRRASPRSCARRSRARRSRS